MTKSARSARPRQTGAERSVQVPYKAGIVCRLSASRLINERAYYLIVHPSSGSETLRLTGPDVLDIGEGDAERQVLDGEVVGHLLLGITVPSRAPEPLDSPRRLVNTMETTVRRRKLQTDQLLCIHMHNGRVPRA